MSCFNFAASATLFVCIFMASSSIECSGDSPAAPNNATTNTKYPPQMLPDATTDIPAWAGKDKDEPFDVKKFLESRAAPPDNAAPLYFEAMADIGSVMDFVYPPDQWKERLPKVKALAEDISKLLIKINEGSVPLTEIEPVLKNSEQALRKLDQAQQKSQCVFFTGMQIDTLLPHLTVAGQFCDLEIEQIYHAQLKGDFAEAELAISRELRLARDIRPRGGMVAQCVSFNLENCILDAINQFTLTQKNLTVKDCDRLLSLLSEHRHDSIPAFQEGFRIDYIMYRNICEESPNVHFFRERFLKYVNANNIMKLTSEDLAQVNWKNEVSALNNLFSTILAMDARPYDKAALDHFDEEDVPKMQRRGTVLVSMQLVKVPTIFKEVIIVQTRDQAHLAGTQSLIAIQRYHLTHGQLPSNLTVAADAAGLKSVSLDPFDGQPMRYKVVNGKPIVYSVGSDQKDDGGTVDWMDGKQPGDYIFRIGD